MIKFLLTSFSITYSSKSKRSSLMFLGTLILVVSILELKNLGANESFLPPSGEPTLAQEITTKLIKRRKNIFFINEI